MRAAVMDVGSNSIKLLVVDDRPDGRLVEIRSQALEVRISAGIGSDKPRLTPEGMQKGIVAIANLAGEAKGLGAERMVAVATSAVRDAANGAEFRERVKTDVGLDLRIVTGAEEAGLIGRGLTTDPALQGLANFQVFDLGGGSLECLCFKDGSVEHAVSLPLGCVRLTEMFVNDPSSPLDEPTVMQIADHVRTVLTKSGFPLPVPANATVVGTGGTLATVRAMVAAKRRVTLDRIGPLISVQLLKETLAATGLIGLAERRRIPGLPPQRADVFPAALVTLLALAELGQFRIFQHSLRNLRWGVASEILG
jgi:exopolyphosphatase / guanosine-5'-triphosphate,3'-diphosphate pyrophosphatase